MTLAERLFALRGLPGFDQLREEELLAVAASMSERQYRPGQVVLHSGSSLWHLLVAVQGNLVAQGTGRALDPVFGADLLLMNRPLGVTLVADDRAGALCLRMSKGHFFTAITECPALLVEWRRARRGGGNGRGAA